NLQRRLAADRDDELGAIHRAFNRMIAAIAEREQVLGLAAISTQGAEDGASPPNWQHIPSRLTLHTLVSQLRSRVTQLSNNVEGNGDGHSDSNVQSTVAIAQKALVNQLDQLLQAVVRVTEFGFPLDLNLARTDIRALLYEVLLRFHEDFSQRNISYELQIAPDVSHATVDRLKLREVLGELVRNALAALPEKGGRLGIRSSLTTEGTELLIEVADDGTGIEQSLIDQTLDTLETPAQEQPNGGLKFTKAIVEQHGGQLMIDSEPGQGTYVQIRLPLTS
ncbi:MAG TPA: HAMP domain-containing sensor histidine kinase, partial [Candidatus Obscuribacterales bacterium]